MQIPLRRQFIYTALLLLFSLAAFSQSQPNPFRRIGKKVDVIDLSKGKYVEIIEKDSLERVGSVLVNRYTRKIERFLDETQADTEVDNTAQSRFFSVDPLARQFPELSPYQFAGNTPIQAVDLDGMEPQGFMEYWKAKTNEYPTKWGYTVQDVYDYKTKQTWTVMHYPNTNEYYYWQTKYEGANRLFIPQNASLNRHENQWSGLFKQFTPTHLSEDRSFHYAMVGMLASPFVAMGAIEGTAAASGALSTYGIGVLTQAATRGIFYYYRYAPAAGVAGRTLAGILDESGAVGAQNAALSRVETFAAKQIEKFITTEEGGLWQVEKFKQVIKEGGEGLKRLLSDPIEAVIYNSKTYILDGHNRLKAFSELGKDANVTILSVEEATKKYKDKMTDIINDSFQKTLETEQ